MLTNGEIVEKLRNSIKLEDVHVHTEDGSHFQIVAVSDQFVTMNRVKRQQLIYRPLAEYIANNSIHAISIQAYTTEEWRLKKKLFNFNSAV